MRNPQPTRSLLTFLLSSAALITGVSSQTAGIDVCACTPATYGLQFNFSAVCPGAFTGDGLAAAPTCLIESTVNVTDVTPVVVRSINILELNIFNQQLGPSNNIVQNIMDRGSVNFDSVTKTNFDNIPTTEIPTLLQISVFAENVAGETVINNVLIAFNNDCDVHPAFEDGATVGWMIFSTVQDAENAICSSAPIPLTSTPTTAPTAAPTPVVTAMPTGTISPTDPDMSLSMSMSMSMNTRALYEIDLDQLDNIDDLGAPLNNERPSYQYEEQPSELHDEMEAEIELTQRASDISTIALQQQQQQQQVSQQKPAKTIKSTKAHRPNKAAKKDTVYNRHSVNNNNQDIIYGMEFGQPIAATQNANTATARKLRIRRDGVN